MANAEEYRVVGDNFELGHDDRIGRRPHGHIGQAGDLEEWEPAEPREDQSTSAPKLTPAEEARALELRKMYAKAHPCLLSKITYVSSDDVNKILLEFDRILLELDQTEKQLERERLVNQENDCTISQLKSKIEGLERQLQEIQARQMCSEGQGTEASRPMQPGEGPK